LVWACACCGYDWEAEPVYGFHYFYFYLMFRYGCFNRKGSGWFGWQSAWDGRLFRSLCCRATMERFEEFCSMKKIALLLLLFTISAGVGLMLWLSYCAGRWGKISLIGAETAGFVVMATGALILMLLIVKRGNSQKFTDNILNAFLAIGIIVGPFAAVRAASYNLLLRTYAAGFEKTVFEVAPITKWQSILSLAQTDFSSKNGVGLENRLPAFVRKVYPHESLYCGMSGDPADLNVAIFWRQPTLVTGLIIGRHGSLGNELYRKCCANDVTVVIAR
jgi:hypothetical protein